MIVVDASAVLFALLARPGPGDAVRDVLRADPDVHAPHLMDVEVMSGLRRRVLLRQTTSDRAGRAMQWLSDLPLTRWEHGPLLARAWTHRDNISSYDAVYVALAELLGATLVTTDTRLGSAPGLRCPVTLLSA